MLELISTIADGLEIAKAITDDQKSATPKLDRMDDEVVAALREMYFTPGGVITLLEDIAAGRRPSEQQIEIVLPRFNDREWQVGRALEALQFESLAGSREVTLRRARTLDRLCYGKINVRRNIQKLLNHALTFDEKVAAGEASRLLERVAELNAQIEALEEAHNYRARR